MQETLARNFNLIAIVMVLFLLAGMFLLVEVGFRTGTRHREREGHAPEGLGTLESGVLGLMGLLLAFSFSGAASRMEKRRDLIVEEANAIGTAYLRVDLVAPEAQPALRECFRNYLDSRIAAYRKMPDINAAQAELQRSVSLQAPLWNQAVAATRLPAAPIPNFLLPPINEMFDVASTRSAQVYAHPPLAIFVMLVALALVSAFMVGFGMASNKDHSRLHALAYAGVLATVIYVIVDLEFPRLGLIRVDAADQLLVDVRESMR